MSALGRRASNALAETLKGDGPRAAMGLVIALELIQYAVWGDPPKMMMINWLQAAAIALILVPCWVCCFVRGPAQETGTSDLDPAVTPAEPAEAHQEVEADDEG